MKNKLLIQNKNLLIPVPEKHLNKTGNFLARQKHEVEVALI